MGQNKTMAIQSIRKKIQVGCALLVFFSILINPTIVQALDDLLIYFHGDYKEQIVGYTNGYLATVSRVRMSGISSYYFDVFDCDGNLYKGGFQQGELPTDEKLYPLTLKLVANVTTSDNYIEMKLTYEKDTSSLVQVPSLISKLDDDLLNKLDQLKEKLMGINDELSKMNDYLSNPAYLEKGMDDLSASVKNISKNPVSDVDSSVTTLSGLKPSGSSSGSFNVPLTIGDQTFNAFDISALSNQLVLIRSLMKAIIWIEFAVFCVRVVVPKFKV